MLPVLFYTSTGRSKGFRWRFGDFMIPLLLSFPGKAVNIWWPTHYSRTHVSHTLTHTHNRLKRRWRQSLQSHSQAVSLSFALCALPAKLLMTWVKGLNYWPSGLVITNREKLVSCQGTNAEGKREAMGKMVLSATSALQRSHVDPPSLEF